MGKLTRIYSCGKGMTTKQLIEMVKDDHVIDVWFPETMFSSGWGIIPVTEYEILMRCSQLVGKTIVTVSEIPTLFFLREIRKGRMKPDELELWCGDRRIDVGINGDMIDPWDGEFFELGLHLRFN